jgi:hypothetical protein
MKKVFLILISAFVLAGCDGGGAQISDIGGPKPRIPERKPAIPSQKGLEANILGPSRFSDATDPASIRALIQRIDNNISPPDIAVQDIERGWYYGQKVDKKSGTPNSWIWVDKGKNSVWVSPSSLDETDDMDLDALCQETAGAYIFSCVEREFSGCEHVAKSVCRCPEDTQWIDKQGCILLGKNRKPVAISQDDLRRGWYLGLPDEKRLDTPANWTWNEAGKQSRWQSPSPF